MKIRNARFCRNQIDIDCEFFSEELEEWLPTTVTPDDPSQEALRGALSRFSIQAYEEGEQEGAREELGVFVRDECRRRIIAVISETDQANLTAAMAAGALSKTEATAFSTGLNWIKSMRASCAKMIEDLNWDYKAEKHWPKPPQKFVKLVETY